MIYLKAAIITALVVAALLAITTLITILWPIMVVMALFIGVVCILKVNKPLDEMKPPE